MKNRIFTELLTKDDYLTYCEQNDIHIFDLIEEPLGTLNKLQMEFIYQ